MTDNTRIGLIEAWLQGIAPKSQSSNVVVYSVMVGHYDRPNPINCEHGFDYFFLTDTEIIAPPPWQTISLPAFGLTPVKSARMAKILAHAIFSNHEHSIYLDASIRVKGSLRTLLLAQGSHPIALLRHPNRRCAYQEVEAALMLGKGEADLLRRQAACYRNLGLPEENGLAATGFLSRRHNDEAVKTLMRYWANQLLENSSRDQVSLAYALWKSDILPYWHQFDVFWNKFFYVAPHADASLYVKSRHRARIFYLSAKSAIERILSSHNFFN